MADTTKVRKALGDVIDAAYSKGPDGRATVFALMAELGVTIPITLQIADALLAAPAPETPKVREALREVGMNAAIRLHSDYHLNLANKCLELAESLASPASVPETPAPVDDTKFFTGYCADALWDLSIKHFEKGKRPDYTRLTAMAVEFAAVARQAALTLAAPAPETPTSAEQR